MEEWLAWLGKTITKWVMFQPCLSTDTTILHHKASLHRSFMLPGFIKHPALAVYVLCKILYSVISIGTGTLFLQVIIELLLNVLLSSKWQAFTKTGAAGIAAVCVAEHPLDIFSWEVAILSIWSL